jgi:hypothetical protein
MIAIQTKYLPATNTKPSRIKAFANKHSVTMSYSECEDLSQHPLMGDHSAIYAQAAIALCRKMDWVNSGYLVSGGLDNGNYVFCFENSDKFTL